MFDDLGMGLSADAIEELDAWHAQACRSQRRMLALIADVDRRESWRDSGARDLAHWLSMRDGISAWKARRWIVAGHALERLPGVADALERGRLGLDKIVELARFASSEDEAALIRWAEGVSCAAIRHRGDVWSRAAQDEVVETHRARTLTWWWLEEERRFGLQAELPAAEGAIVARAIERLAERIPVMPDEDGDSYRETRRADALVALCSSRVREDTDPARPTVVIHAQARGLADGTGGCEVEQGTAIAPETVRRLLCNARIQTVVEDGAGSVVGLGRMWREPSAWMVRQVRYRDRECRFPGCGSRRFTEAHHIVWWRHGGPTDLDNLMLVCWFHHRLVHEYGWSVKRRDDGTVAWFDHHGIRYRAGPSPPSMPMGPPHRFRCQPDGRGLAS